MLLFLHSSCCSSSPCVRNSETTSEMLFSDGGGVGWLYFFHTLPPSPCLWTDCHSWPEIMCQLNYL